jgi:hypothetical protein
VENEDDTASPEPPSKWCCEENENRDVTYAEVKGRTLWEFQGMILTWVVIPNGWPMAVWQNGPSLSEGSKCVSTTAKERNI